MATSSSDPLLLPMPCRELPRTGWRASRLTVGGVKWDSHIPEAEAVALLRRAMDLGVNTFDTARGYGKGESERRLGLAIRGRRQDLFLSTKTTERSRDGALRDLDASVEALGADVIDLIYVHALDDEEDLRKVLGRDSVLDALREAREAGRIRFLGVSGHWFKDSMETLIREADLDAILLPVGLFNRAYGYSYFDAVVPAARERGMAVLGMKVFGAGRVKHAASIEPYLRYSLHQDVDSLVIGCDSIAQLEASVRAVKCEPPPLRDAELPGLEAEALAITRSWDKGEFDWVRHYR